MADLAGKKAVLKIVDDAKGGWGHLNVDQIVQSDTRPKGMVSGAERSFAGNARYLNIPIKNGAKKHVVIYENVVVFGPMPDLAGCTLHPSGDDFLTVRPALVKAALKLAHRRRKDKD